MAERMSARKRDFKHPEDYTPAEWRALGRAGQFSVVMQSNLLRRGYDFRSIGDIARCLVERLNGTVHDNPRISGLADLNTVIRALKWPPERFTSLRQLRYHQRADWYGSPNELRAFGRDLYIALRKRGVPTYFHTCWRSPELQLQLYRAGHSTLKSGSHQRSCAFDLVHSDLHWECPPEFWEYVGTVGKHIASQKSYPIEWGGDWTEFPDPAHWQIKNWREYPEVPDHYPSGEARTKPVTSTPEGLLKIMFPQDNHF
jgi:hypothetical protein